MLWNYWAFYFIPVVTHLAYLVFADIHLSRLQFFLKYGPYVKNIVFAGLMDQVHELLVRHPDNFLYAHHCMEMFASILLLDVLPMEQKCAGALFLGLQSGYDKLMYCVIFASYFHKQRSLRVSDAAQPAVSSAVIEVGADTLFPSSASLCVYYRVAFYYYTVLVRMMVSTSTTVFCCLKWHDMVLLWQILLPITVFFFFVVDYLTYLLLWRRSVPPEVPCVIHETDQEFITMA